MLSRVDERIGSMTPQQPIKLGANTVKVQVLWMIIKTRLLTFVLYKGFLLYKKYNWKNDPISKNKILEAYM